MTLHCDAVLLGSRPLGEADLVAVVFTCEHGKIRAAARHARRSTRRFAGGLVAGAMGRAELTQRPGGLWRFEGFVPELNHGAMGRDLDRFAHAAYLCELTDALVDEAHPEPPIFVALQGALHETLDGPRPDALVLRRYELALLIHLGHFPALFQCCVCAEALPAGPVGFDAARGGPVCKRHDGGATQTPAQLWDLVRDLLDPVRPVASCGAGEGDSPVDPGLRRALRDLTAGQIRRHLHRPLRSVAFFGQIAGASGHEPPP